MPETTKKCQVKMLYGKSCGRELYDDEHCIFHSKNTDKSKEVFQQKLSQLTSKHIGHVLDLNGFIFPDGIIIDVGGPREINFYNSIFQGTFSFNQVHATAKLVFGNAIFKKDVNLDGLVFESEVHFGSAEFEGEVWFRRAVFKDKTYVNPQFKKQACFSDVTFGKEVDFSEAKFEDKAIFFETKFIFPTKCRFERCTFGASVDFRSCRFEGDTVFQDSFSKARGNNKIDFRGAQIGGSFIVSEEKNPKAIMGNEIDFRGVQFTNPQTVKFDKVNLSMFRFSGTDMRQIEFVDVAWNKEKNKGRDRVFDEVSPDPETQKFDYALIAQLYRRLRANYEENLRYSEAGDFYIGEMEMTRKAEKNIFRKLPLLFYKAISKYGESYYRPLGWIAVILLIFPFLFMFVGIQPVSLDPNNPIQDVINYSLDFSSIHSFLPSAEKIGDYYTSFLYSMSVFSFIRDKKYTTIDNWGHTLFVLESILGPVTLAFFLLALRRRFKR